MSASLWGCELKFALPVGKHCSVKSASLWGCELKCSSVYTVCYDNTSASLWGCELKWKSGCFVTLEHGQPPCEAVSWNVNVDRIDATVMGQPPCEAVSWNIKLDYERRTELCQPPCEAVSWNPILSTVTPIHQCQPPCEAVSWNVSKEEYDEDVQVSASLWGCELKFLSLTVIPINSSQPPCEAVSWNEKALDRMECGKESASLWGCELKWPGDSIHAGTLCVSLLVRLWVEIIVSFSPDTPLLCQPPCEAVSWNLWCYRCSVGAIQSASLWGCELKWWKVAECNYIDKSASLWGCELKLVDSLTFLHHFRQPPCEAVSWNIFLKMLYGITLVSLLVRLWVEITQ